MGFNGEFLCVRADGDDAGARIGAAIEAFFARADIPLVDHDPLTPERWSAERRLFSFGVSPPVQGWIGVADSERSLDRELARFIAEHVPTVVVISSIYEICDPPEPEQITVFGAPPADHHYGLYTYVASGYRHLADRMEARFFTFRAPAPRTHADHVTPTDATDGDIPF